MITDIEQETLDIDWFFTNGEGVGFVASGGGKLPKSISKSSIETTEQLVNYFKDLPQKGGVVVNPDLKKILARGTNMAEYLRYFIQITEKGLFSFDKTVLNNFSDTNYHWVAKPLIPLRLDELTSEIADILIKTKLNGKIKENLNTVIFQ